MLSVSPTNPQPLYQQVIEQLRALILIGDLQPGQPLPSVRQLAADISTSVITTRRAYLELEREGLIVTSPGRGTFVAELSPDRRREVALRLLEREMEALLVRARALRVDPRALQSLFRSWLEGHGGREPVKEDEG
ncbi:MAG TPA: GntR family transcriptional regulator [Bacillota bacterium]|nr:GntR family transcriptional regulator [Bacillota bacterium]